MPPVIYSHSVRKPRWSLTLLWMSKLKEPLKKKLKHFVEHFVYNMVRQKVSNNSNILFIFQDQDGNIRLKVINNYNHL